MVDVAGGEPVFSQEEDNLSDTERYEIDDFTFISSELAQDVGDGPAEKVDSTEFLPSPPNKGGKKKKSKLKQKKVSEPGDVVVPHDNDTGIHTEASAEVPEKQKKSERKRLKRTRSDSEDEYEEEIEVPKKRKDKSTQDEDDEDDKLEKRRRRSDKKKEELDSLASIRKAKEKIKDKIGDKSRERVKDKEKEKEKEEPTLEPGSEGSDSEPEDTEVVPVSTFLSEFRPSGALVEDATPKRRSKFGESILSKRPASPHIVPFERPRIKHTAPAPTPKPSQLSQLPTEPNVQTTQWGTNNDQIDIHGFPHHQWDKLMEQQQSELQQQLQPQQLLQQLLPRSLLSNGPSEETSLHKNHKHKKHAKDKAKREKEKRDKEKEKEKGKRDKAKREKKHKREKPQKLDPTTPEYTTKRKEFKLKLSETIGVRLKKYLRANRIATKDDFKHLARKFTHKIMDLEDAKGVFVIKQNTEEKIHKVIDAYFERHNTYSRSGASLPTDQPDLAVDDV